jgi:hypothetical protein
MYSVNITNDGKKALLQLSNGDMRRALNILQVFLFFYLKKFLNSLPMPPMTLLLMIQSI